MKDHCNRGIDATFSDTVDNIPDPSEHDPNRKNILVFDDIMLGPQNKAEAYYTRGPIFLNPTFAFLDKLSEKMQTCSSSSDKTTRISVIYIKTTVRSMVSCLKSSKISVQMFQVTNITL